MQKIDQAPEFLQKAQDIDEAADRLVVSMATSDLDAVVLNLLKLAYVSVLVYMDTYGLKASSSTLESAVRIMSMSEYEEARLENLAILALARVRQGLGINLMNLPQSREIASLDNQIYTSFRNVVGALCIAHGAARFRTRPNRLRPRRGQPRLVHCTLN